MAKTNKSSSKWLLEPDYLFLPLAGLGLLCQWTPLLATTAFAVSVEATKAGVLANGGVLKLTWTGIEPIDFVLRYISVTFAAFLDVHHDPTPFLLLFDLVFSLAVWDTVILTESRRDKTGPLRNSAFWSLMRNYFGAASVLPTYFSLYIKKQPQTGPKLPRNEAQAIPFTTIWNLLLASALLFPTLLGAHPFRIQDGLLLWFWGPLSVGLFQRIASSLIASSGLSYKGSTNPIGAAYNLVGAVSSLAHLSVSAWIFSSPNLTFSGTYLPNPWSIHEGPTIFVDVLLVFIQFGYTALTLSVLALGFYTLSVEKVTTAKSSRSVSLPTFLGIVAVAGPGAGLAWLFRGGESESEATSAKNKNS
ncbi:uncharacterized protein F4822DRAFT_276849 [Hypoxylon trugodes]|uniref:uncharacterized protein n=1 Tax=Hypoxylon trugodes TaxID=326681 RepID=UPI0021A03C3E|nr:uncharacterized protein F4822DRAFT_276849 [Hypoxylon trugodes]KAI1387219.1 hypothetical protein F4822DRAFT_276849 [Hypoxylon trugodes]